MEVGTIRIDVRIFRHYIWVSTGGEGCEQLYDQQNIEEDNLLGVKTPFVSMMTTHSQSNTCIHFVVFFIKVWVETWKTIKNIKGLLRDYLWGGQFGHVQARMSKNDYYAKLKNGVLSLIDPEAATKSLIMKLFGKAFDGVTSNIHILHKAFDFAISIIDTMKVNHGRKQPWNPLIGSTRSLKKKSRFH